MPAKRRDPRAPSGLLSPAEARRRLTSLIRELEAQPSLRIPIGVGTAQVVLVTPELLERLDGGAKNPEGRAGPAAQPAPVEGDDAPDRGVQRLVKKLIKSVKE